MFSALYLMKGAPVDFKIKRPREELKRFLINNQNGFSYVVEIS